MTPSSAAPSDPPETRLPHVDPSATFSGAVAETQAGASRVDSPITTASVADSSQARRPSRRGSGPDRFFDAQPTPRGLLPDPEPLCTNLARCVLEILAGAREIEQIARWVTDEVYRHVMKRVILAARGRSARGAAPSRPNFHVGTVRVTEPTDGVVEAVVVVHGRARTRAVALRLEGLDRRWRATAVHVL